MSEFQEVFHAEFGRLVAEGFPKNEAASKALLKAKSSCESSQYSAHSEDRIGLLISPLYSSIHTHSQHSKPYPLYNTNTHIRRRGAANGSEQVRHFFSRSVPSPPVFLLPSPPLLLHPLPSPSLLFSPLLFPPLPSSSLPSLHPIFKIHPCID